METKRTFILTTLTSKALSEVIQKLTNDFQDDYEVRIKKGTAHIIVKRFGIVFIDAQFALYLLDRYYPDIDKFISEVI